MLSKCSVILPDMDGDVNETGIFVPSQILGGWSYEGGC